MRRGHPGNIGWRNENPRHFRPRSGGTPHYRPPRGYGLLEMSRFPPPGPRPRLHFNTHGGPMDVPPAHHDRNPYRGDHHPNNHPRARGRGQQYGQRQMFPIIQRMRSNDGPDHNNHYKEKPNYYEDQNMQYHHNNMGDVDNRHISNAALKRDCRSPWVNPPFNDDRTQNNLQRHYDGGEVHKRAMTDYTGHRPPASDHYGSTPVPTPDNSNTFSRSVDDTVNIVRKRLLSRESQPSDNPPMDNHNEIKVGEPMTSNYYNIQHSQPMKRKSHMQRQNEKSNCDKIKNKIVHQLFMMDKEKIHKLMDNPSSSTKFEYAISSLITESQNSYNRHLRSVAEKSLCGTSSDFIHNDTNTIYEDTFMKQMQCLLEPQDTVLLEDIKPMVLAELSRVLQLNDFEARHEIEEQAAYTRDESGYSQYQNESLNYDDHHGFDPVSPDVQSAYHEQNPVKLDYDERSHTSSIYHQQNPLKLEYDERSYTSSAYGNDGNQDYENFEFEHKPLFEKRIEDFQATPLFERRRSRRSPSYSHDRQSNSDNRHRQERLSRDKSSESKFRGSGTPVPFFDPNADQLSEDDDTFAELDRQYHVVIDHNFIATDDPSGSPQSIASISPIIKPVVPTSLITPETHNRPCNVQIPELPTHNIKQEIDNQLQYIAKSPLKLLATKSKTEADKLEASKIRQQSINQNHSVDNPALTLETRKVTDKHEARQPPDPIVTHQKVSVKSEPTGNIQTTETKSSTTLIPSSSRKRSIDQRPSHRKEKRKKSESSQDPDSKVSNKNNIINLNDCTAKENTPKSIFNLLIAQEENGKQSSQDSKIVDSKDKGYSDKYVKRKETPKKTSKDREGDSKKKHNSSSSSHSILSPTDNNSCSSSQTSSKADSKIKLKPIDMFTEQPRKPTATHQPHRNTTAAANKPNIENKCKPMAIISASRKLTRHISTQVTRKSFTKETQTNESKSNISKYCQTERKKTITRGAQTEPVSLKPVSKSTDAFERMKEIDMEIQSLLQEKFKLYSSLESKESCPGTMQSLGMAVLNVTPFEETKDDAAESKTADAIVEDFTNIPVEELEQIALESVTQENNENVPVEKKTRRQLIANKRNSSASPAKMATITSKKKAQSKRKAETPNISLIEKIITDDRPLEDIISLDAFEVSPTKSKKKAKTSSKSKKKSNKKNTKTHKPLVNITGHSFKECSVVLVREEVDGYLRRQTEQSSAQEPEEPVIEQQSNILEETVVNDLQFDMLDVSEDIVIGDMCEVKSEDKDVNERDVLIEEVILDNSQSAMEEAGGEGGQIENECKMFDYSADERLRRDSTVVSGHADAVLAIECMENNFIAACLDGNVYHFTSDGQLLNTLRGSNLAVTCLTIVKEKYGTTVYTGSLDSRIRYYDLETGLEKGPECNVLSPIQTMDRAWDTVFVGTRTGFVLQFECKNNMLIPVSTVKFSDQSILALRAMKEGPRKVLLVAARSDAVTIKDAQTGLLLRTLEGPMMTVYTILFEDGKVYCGTSSHQIHVFDYVSGSHCGTHESGKGAVCLRAAGGLLFAGCYDGCVYVYREGEARALAQLRGPSPMLLSLAVVGTKIIAGYKDRSLYIWKIPLSIVQEMIL